MISARSRLLRCAGLSFSLLLAVATQTSLTVAVGKVGPVAQVKEPPAGTMVRVNPVSSWEEAKGDLQLLPGASIKTGVSSIELRFSDGARVIIEPASIVQLQVPTEINLDAGTATRVSRLDIKEGSLQATIPTTARPLLVMASKDVYAAFRPGRARAKMLPDGLLAIIDEGSGRVAAAGRWASLAAKQYQVLRLSGAQQGPKQVPAAPTFLKEPCRAGPGHACAIAVVVEDTTAVIGARWEPVAPGSRCVVTVARDAELRDVVSKQDLEGEATSYATPPLPAGTYWMSVHLATPDGVEGTRAVRPMRIVRLLPEPGVTFLAAAQLLVVPPGRKVKLDGGSGLQISFTGNDFNPAPTYLQMDQDGRQRPVHLRIEGDATDRATIMLEPRGLRADVDLHPKNAHWPRDAVTIQVYLVDPRHRMSSDQVLPRLRVKVNNTPLQVPLVRSGSVWRGQIQPRNGRGPWVIRAEVLDADDNLLGIGMLEVVGQDSQSKSPGLW